MIRGVYILHWPIMVVMIDRKGNSSEQMDSKRRRTNKKEEGDRNLMDLEGMCVNVVFV